MSATLKCDAFQNEHVTGRFPSLFPAKSAPGYSNKMPIYFSSTVSYILGSHGEQA